MIDNHFGDRQVERKKAERKKAERRLKEKDRGTKKKIKMVLK